MDDYDLKVILSQLTPYEQAQVFCVVFSRWFRRPRRRWTVEEYGKTLGQSYVTALIIG